MNIRLIVAIALPLAVGFVSGYATTANIPTWYAGLEKPWFNPPNWLFGPVWTLLYILMGYASYLIFKANHPKRKAALVLYGVQLLFNFMWSIIFFHWKMIDVAMAEITLLWVLINLTIVAFAGINKRAAYLLLPYVVWVSFAAILNYYILVLNT